VIDRVKAAGLLSLILMVGVGCSEPVNEPGNENDTPQIQAQAFHQWLDTNYAVDMQRNPYTASYRGIKDNHGAWNSYAESGYDESRSINETRLEQLLEFDRATFSKQDQLSYDLYRVQLESSLASDDFRHHKFIIHQYRGPHTQAASNLINIHTLSNVADAQAYIQRLNNISGWFDEVIEQMRIRQKKALLLADWQYPQIVESASNIISGAPYDDSGGDSTLWADFQKKLALLDIEQAQREELLDQARTAFLEQVKPAYERLITELEREAPMASGDDGVWKFKNGEAFYAERLHWFTTTDLTAEEVHALGLREVARIQEEMKVVMARVKFDGSLPEFMLFMREDEQFYYPDSDAGREAYLAQAERFIEGMYSRLPTMFGVLPKAELTIKRVEAFRERSAGKAFYQGPPPDGSRPGIYYANLYNMRNMPTYQMEALAYHEGVPGHHLQLAIAAELTEVPEFQKFTSFTAFSEGWGLYSEKLSKEMGFYQDPYSDFGRLAMELWRAARLVVDTGLHHQRWTREEAIAYLVANTPNSENDCVRAIERYIAMPGQATAYMIGKLKIEELRDKAREAMGDDFDIRDFHDGVLRDGRVPLEILERKVDAMISGG
jgi:uncharacterized protein (DUF885 family)